MSSIYFATQKNPHFSFYYSFTAVSPSVRDFTASSFAVIDKHSVCTLYRARRFSAAVTVEEPTNILSVVDNGGRAGEEHTSLESPPTTARIAAVAS